MPVEVFRNREIDLLTLEDKVRVLEQALAEERQAYDEWVSGWRDLEEALNAEREAWHESEKQLIKEKYRWGEPKPSPIVLLYYAIIFLATYLLVFINSTRPRLLR